MLQIGYDDIVNMLRLAAGEIRHGHARLSELDSHGGDGDHGTTMLRAMSCMEKAIDACAERTIQKLLHDVGWAIMGVDGGATGPLLGTLFMSMAEATGGRELLDAAGVVAMFEAGLAGVQRQTKAKVGDKTMMDALVPAVQAMAREAARISDVPALLKVATCEAHTGAESTKDLQARFGRAKNLGPKSIGNPDAGATSIFLIFRGFYHGLRFNG